MTYADLMTTPTIPLSVSSDPATAGCLVTTPELTTTSPFVATMKSSLLLSLYSVSLAAAIAHPKEPQVVLQNPQVTIEEPDEYLIELSPGETRWVTEDEKWALRRVRIRLND